jgi:hypothetical protein
VFLSIGLKQFVAENLKLVEVEELRGLNRFEKNIVKSAQGRVVPCRDQLNWDTQALGKLCGSEANSGSADFHKSVYSFHNFHKNA